MKKIVAMLLALIMVLSMASVAMADSNFTPTAASTDPVTINGFEKDYDVTGASSSTSATVYPKEELAFISVANTANPDGGTANLSEVEFTAATSAQKSSEDEALSYDLSFKHPAYTLPGLYHFELTEDDTKTQGVTKDDDKIYISVLVTTDENNVLTIAGLGITKQADETTGMNQEADPEADSKKKDDVVNNKLDLGKLTVSKTVEGNMADSSVFFTITVKLKPEEGKTVRNKVVITATDGESTTDKTEIDGTTNPWDDEQTVTLTIKAGGSVVFEDLPVGVTYTVEEAEEHIAAAAKDIGGNGDPTEKDTSKGYHVTYTDEEGTISATASNAIVNNKKDVTIDTGVAITAVPYVMILAVAMVGAAMMIIRRRKEEM